MLLRPSNPRGYLTELEHKKIPPNTQVSVIACGQKRPVDKWLWCQAVQSFIPRFGKITGSYAFIDPDTRNVKYADRYVVIPKSHTDRKCIVTSFQAQLISKALFNERPVDIQIGNKTYPFTSIHDTTVYFSYTKPQPTSTPKRKIKLYVAKTI